ncbi:Six-hairpin glycosidase-like protein [Xylogone sp. PMI_703]|nr:Six-hairpin glycosidase-like protein [Xylogone sp. PMI_703]
MATRSFNFRFFVILLSLSSVLANSCWRDTVCTGPKDTAFPGKWQSNIFAPSSRTISPKSILSLQTGKTISHYPGNSKLSGNGSALVFDFGIEVGGLVTLKYEATGPGAIGLAFTEAKNWIGEWSDSSNGEFKGPDGAVYANFTSAGRGTYAMPDNRLRGGFRYMTAFLITEGHHSVSITDVSLEIGFQPTWSNLQAYQGYFHSSDQLLNKIWYSGAYTLQTNAVPVNTGRQVPFLITGWANNGTLGPGDTIIVDGAKRDRAVWPGDMGVAVPSTFVSIGDLDSVKNALQTMYNNQNPKTGAFPEAGPPLLQQGSDTYHMWSMIGTYNYVLYTNDTAFLLENWAKYLLAMNYIYGKVTYASGLLNVTGTRDWARWQQGYNNTEANMILYRTLITGADLATWAGDTTGLSSTWLTRASNLRKAINEYCWDGHYGSFKDNATATTLHPQDANSMAILFDVVDSTQKAQEISTKLLKNWTPIGAVTPELPENISPFISSFEIQAHLTIGQTERALDLIRRSWGWYINHPNGTGSTVIEGYLQNGTFGYRSSRGYDYDASYVSHSHGWSSGPTSALTNYVLGLSVTAPSGSSWKLAPQFGDLSSVEGGFTTGLGKYQAKWQNFGILGYTLEFNVPRSTKGQLVLPTLTWGLFPKIQLDGKQVNRRRRDVQITGASVVLEVDGGSHSVHVA